MVFTICTFTKLKPGKKYYVRFRSYKKSVKEKQYGAWSKAKQGIKVKKQNLNSLTKTLVLFYNSKQSVERKPHEGVHHRGCSFFVAAFFMS